MAAAIPRFFFFCTCLIQQILATMIICLPCSTKHSSERKAKPNNGLLWKQNRSKDKYLRLIFLFAGRNLKKQLLNFEPLPWRPLQFHSRSFLLSGKQMCWSGKGWGQRGSIHTHSSTLSDPFTLQKRKLEKEWLQAEFLSASTVQNIKPFLKRYRWNNL